MKTHLIYNRRLLHKILSILVSLLSSASTSLGAVVCRDIQPERACGIWISIVRGPQTSSVGGAKSSHNLFVASDGIFSNPRPQARVVVPGQSQRKGWRGLVPLRSTRRDVEAIVGQPATPAGSSYQTSNETIYVQYSDGPCEKGWPYGWNVPSDTVVTISISPKESVPLATLNVDLSKYQKWQAGHIADRVHYTDHNEGVDFEVDEFRGHVISVSYGPTIAQSSLQCPDASNRLPPGRRQADSFHKFDELGDVPVSYERERLDLFAAEMRRRPNLKGYIISYAGMTAHTGEAKTRADCARKYLIEKHGIKAETIRAIDGGYRETRLMELYVEPRGGDLPLARPTVRPSKVKIIEAERPIGCDTHDG